MLTDSEIDRYEEYIEDPPIYVEEVLGATTLEDYQKKILVALTLYDRLAIKACHSVGKTWLMARAALWFFNIFPNSIVITTAPTYRQVKALLWGEIRDAHKNSLTPLGGRLLDTELKFSDKHYMMGFSPQKKAGNETTQQQGSSFQGFHSDYVFVIFDEATGVAPDVWTMAEGLLTSGKMVKFVAIANPTTKNCKFFECFSDPSWKKLQISCFDSPNLIANRLVNKEALQAELDRLSVLSDDERIEEIQRYAKPVPYLLTAQFVVPYVLKLGMDHPLVLSKVFGEFPNSDDNVLVQYEDVNAAQNREVEIRVDDQRFIGVDVARFGADKTVLTELTGYKQTDLVTLSKRSLSHVTGEVINLINKEPKKETIVAIDATGLGAGVYDNLVEAQREKVFGKNIVLVECHNGATPVNDNDTLENQVQDKARYFNLKAKMFDLLAEDLRHRLEIFNESIYLEELPSIKYAFDSKGKIVIESKDKYKERTGRSSPDFSDSLALANLCRHLSIKPGIFVKRSVAEPLVKRSTRKERKSSIKIREY